MSAPTAETLRRALDRIPGSPFEGMVYRQHAPAYSALSGQGARLNGGRWNAPRSFEVIYTALDRSTVRAEFKRQLSRARLAPGALLSRRLATVRVKLANVLDLREMAVRDALGVGLAELTADDPGVARAIGQAAFDVGFEAVVAPSATGEGDILAIFPGNRRPATAVELVREADFATLS